MDIASFRSQHPEYADLSDDALTTALHQKYYPDMRFEDFKSRFQGPQQQAEPQTSTAGAFATGLGQSLFGLGDEIEAGVRAAIDPNRTYDDIIPEVRKRVEQSAAEHPYAYYTGEIGGTLAMPLGAAKAGVSLINKARTLKGAMGAGAVEGAAWSAAYGAGRSEGDLGDRAQGAAEAAPWGAAIGGVAPAVIGGASHVYGKARDYAQSITNPREAASRAVGRAVLDDEANAFRINAIGGRPMSVEANPVAENLVRTGRAGDDLMVADTGANTQSLMRSAANNSPTARAMIESKIYPRSEGQTERATDFLRSLTGLKGDTVQRRETLLKASRDAVSPVYRKAYEVGDRPVWSAQIERLTGAPMVREAMQAAEQTGKNRAIRDGLGAFNTRVEFDPSGILRFKKGPEGVPTYPNLQYWDEVKRNLDSIAGKALRAGDKQTASDAAAFAKTLRSELDGIVPEFAAARSIAETFFKADDALQAGINFAKGGFPIKEAKQAISKMSPSEKILFREGFLDHYLERTVGKTGDNRNLALKLVNSKADREAFEAAFPDGMAREFEAFMHIENVMEGAKRALGNSTTARQLMELGMAGTAGQGVQMLGGGNPFDPTGFLVGASLRFGGKKLDDAVKRKMADHIAVLLTKPMNAPEVQAAIRDLAKPENLNVLRVMSQSASRAGGALAGQSMSED